MAGQNIGVDILFMDQNVNLSAKDVAELGATWFTKENPNGESYNWMELIKSFELPFP